MPDPLAELKGFEIAGAFGYDGNGNFTSDGDQGLAIVSNPINLPRIVASPGDSLLFEYTFGGEKIRKLQTGPLARERIYLGGAEFVNDTLELYHHLEGRVVWRDTTPAFQYRIADHLGNTVVFFEDRDGDTQIKTESMTSDPDSLEVLQRNYYYAFGMEMEGPWNSQTGPGMRYLYNGKEFNEDLGLRWYDYGARYYDPSIGRWNGVDPLAEKYASISPYAYVANNPLIFIDPDGRDIIVGGQVWTPGATGEGQSDFVKQTFAALNYLTKDVSAGMVSTKERTGHVILDFVGENAIGDVEIVQGSLFGDPHRTSEDGTQINFSEDIGIFLQGDNTESGESGVMSPATILGHEFGHAWLAQGSPQLNALFEKIDASPYNRDEPINQEHKWLTPLVQSFSRANGEEVPKTLRDAASDKAGSVNLFGIPSDYFTETNGSTSTEEKN